MSYQLIGVSPPPMGQALDSKVDLKKDFKETSAGAFKIDFEKALKEKLAAKKNNAEAGPPKRELKTQKDDKENEVDSEEKKTSGGTKKRMNEKVDDQMISMIMASNESEVEVPEPKTTDLAQIEESQPQVEMSMALPMQNAVEAKAFVPFVEAPLPHMPVIDKAIADVAEAADVVQAIVPGNTQIVESELSPELMQALQGLPQPMPQKVEASAVAQQQMASEVQQIRNSFVPVEIQRDGESTESEDDDVSPKLTPDVPLMDAGPASAVKTEDAVSNLIQKIKALDTAAPDAPIEARQASVVAPLAIPSVLAAMIQTESMPEKTFDLERELNEEVGFEPQVDQEKSAKMDAQEKPVSLKTQEFQKSVYEQLQKMDQRPYSGALQSHPDKKSGQEQIRSEDISPINSMLDSTQPSELHHVGQTSTEFKTQLGAPVLGGSEQHRTQLLEQNHDKNIQEVMNQAQYLVKKGGGEMKVSMSPDGVSEVQLKVMLQDGKVNIEMRTQDKTVKKLMEDSLTELKSGLAAHNLSVDHVKISSVSATNTDNSAQFQSNWNQSSGEHRQREYWNQFQESLNQNSNTPRRSSYAPEAGSSEVRTAGNETAERVSATPRTYGGTKGSQINWVA